MADSTTLGSFAQRQIQQQWDMAWAGAREQLRKLAALVATEQRVMEHGEVPATNLSETAAKYEYWQAVLTVLDHLRGVLNADGADMPAGQGQQAERLLAEDLALVLPRVRDQLTLTHEERAAVARLDGLCG